MTSRLTFALSNGREVEISLVATDGARLRVGEVFEVVRHCGQALGEFDGAVELAADERAVQRALSGVVRRAPGQAVTSAKLVPALRRRLPKLTPRQLERLLPRVMTSEYGVTCSHDLPGRPGARRGYRGIALRHP